MAAAFEDIRPMFQPEDGSNPEICVSPMSGEAVTAGFASILSRAGFLVGSPVFYDLGEKGDRPVRSVPNAAELVVSGRAKPFHVLCRKIGFPSGVIPELGIFVFSNGFALDYEKDQTWQKQSIAAFFDLVRDLLANAPEAHIHLDSSIPDGQKQAFLEILDRFIMTGAFPE